MKLRKRLAPAADDQQGMTVIEHLAELRKRIIIALAALTVGVVVAFLQQERVFTLLKRPLLSSGVQAQLITLSPSEPFMTVLKVSIYAGFLLALPIILWQFWAYIMPALYEQERKMVLPYVLVTAGLFLGGVVFAYYLVLPVGLKFLVGYGGEIFLQQLRAGEYVSFVSLFLLAFGVTFELPIVLLLLSSLGLIDSRMLRKQRRVAVVVIAAVAMVLTPSADPVSMLLMMGPLYLLYEFGIMLTRASERRRARREVALP